MPVIELNEELDKAVESAMPEHFGGPRKAKLRVEHILHEWLLKKQREQRAVVIQGRDTGDETVGSNIDVIA